jgi:hypothetical protein
MEAPLMSIEKRVAILEKMDYNPLYLIIINMIELR